MARRPLWPVAVALIALSAALFLVGIWTSDHRWAVTGTVVLFATGLGSAVAAVARWPL